MFPYSDSEAIEKVYLEGLEEILLYYKTRGIRIKVIRTDDFTTFKSWKARNYYAKHGIERQSSTSYQHWQNAVERDIQTMIHNISAVIHGSLEPSAQTLDQSAQQSSKISTPGLTQRNHGHHASSRCICCCCHCYYSCIRNHIRGHRCYYRKISICCFICCGHCF
jgi:hypothetical protein